MIYNKYSKYKETVFQWYKYIPYDWEIKCIRYISDKVLTGSTPPSALPELFEGDLLWFTPSDFNDKYELEKSSRTISEQAISEGYVKLYPPNSVLIVSIGTIGKVGLCKDKSSSNQQINAILLKDNIYPKYFTYALASQRETLENISNATLLGIMNQEKTKQFHIPIPSKDEQKPIADFLDYKTSQIDKLIEEKERLLELLEEKRIALITKVVTKGLNPEVKMKPSGIDWLGDIPDHWEVKRLKFTVDLINDKVDYDDYDLSYMGLENIESWTGKKIDTIDYEPEGTVNHFQKGDVLFGKLRPYLAKSYLALEAGLCTTEALVLRCVNKLLPEYLINFMLTHFFIDVVDSSTYGAKMPRANWDFIGSLPILIPTKQEQIQIFIFLEKEKNIIDNLHLEIDKAITKLKEYRSALITSAVTGKIDVRNFKPEHENEKTY